MTVINARKMLGTSFKHYSDLEIKRIIAFYQRLCCQIINSYLEIDNKVYSIDGSNPELKSKGKGKNVK